MRKIVSVVMLVALTTTVARAVSAADRPMSPIEGDVLELPAEDTFPVGVTYTPELRDYDLEVEALRPSGEVVEVLGMGQRLERREKPIEVPQCLTWWITPGEELSDAYLARIAAELRTHSIPGLSLARTRPLGRCIVIGRRGDISDEGLKALEDVNGLVWLSLRETGVGDGGLRHLRGLKSLRFLDLTFCRKVTDRGLEHLASIHSLRQLRLSFSGVSGKGLAVLRDLPNLRSLEYWQDRALTDAGMEEVGRLTQLIELDLSSSTMTDAGLERLNGLAGLRRLSLSCCHEVTGSAFAKLDGLRRLESLELTMCFNFDEDQLEHLATLPRLERLHLDRVKITDAALRRIASLKGLKSLSLAFAPVTDEGLQELRAMHLRELKLRGCPGVTLIGVDALQKALPSCEITVIPDRLW